MSGHSKWSSIKHKKAAKDAKRGKLFSKLIKEITVAARLGGGDISGNPRLRTAVLAARGQSMPNDNIERAIKKGTGELEGAAYEEVTYEGYASGGVAVMVQALTDNRNRTVADMRRLFEKHGGNLGASGCVAWMFHKKGVILVDHDKASEERLMDVTLSAGAEDLSDTGDQYEIVTDPQAFAAVKDALDRAKIEVASAEITLVPESTTAVSGKAAQHTMALVEELEDHDDVQTVSANFDIAPEELERLSAA
ncbi:MAG TPA: YebC/PmpR family DNA-binding transcriptional regulator [Candidatus Binatia bacterium]|nr:YebC/PmpR family DNA-binding transcriptional regulator [Candidatus Binatia bacterium]